MTHREESIYSFGPRFRVYQGLNITFYLLNESLNWARILLFGESGETLEMIGFLRAGLETILSDSLQILPDLRRLSLQGVNETFLYSLK